MPKKLPNSTRKFIRSEKARIRRQFLDYKAQEEAIASMYNKILNQPVKKAELEKPVKLKVDPIKQKERVIAKKPKAKGRKTKIRKKKKI